MIAGVFFRPPGQTARSVQNQSSKKSFRRNSITAQTVGRQATGRSLRGFRENKPRHTPFRIFRLLCGNRRRIFAGENQSDRSSSLRCRRQSLSGDRSGFAVNETENTSSIPHGWDRRQTILHVFCKIGGDFGDHSFRRILRSSTATETRLPRTAICFAPSGETAAESQIDWRISAAEIRRSLNFPFRPFLNHGRFQSSPPRRCRNKSETAPDKCERFARCPVSEHRRRSFRAHQCIFAVTFLTKSSN